MKSCHLALLACLVCFAHAHGQNTDLTTIKARTLELQVPKDWVPRESTSSMRAAEFSIPGEKQNADLVVFYFGGPTGGVKANIERWIGQFQKEGLKLNMYQGKCKAGRYLLVDTQGTWNKPDGSPFAQKTVSTPDSRVLNVIVIEEKDGEQDYYFLKLSGHQETVGNLTDKIREAIGADKASEKTFDLKDAS